MAPLTATRASSLAGDQILPCILCYRELDSWRDPVAGREISCHEKKRRSASAQCAAPNSFRFEPATSTISRNASRLRSWPGSDARLEKLENQPHRFTDFFQALSLGISGERAFCFSVGSTSPAEYRASRALFLEGREAFGACVPLTRKPVPKSPLQTQCLQHSVGRAFATTIRFSCGRVSSCLFRSWQRPKSVTPFGRSLLCVVSPGVLA